MLDNNLAGKVDIGDGKESRTKSFQYFEYTNQHLIGSNKGIILNTIGLGDTNLSISDSDIVLEIYKEVMENASKKSGGVDTFYFVQGLDATPIKQIERSLLLMQAALGESIFKSSVILATKGNKLADDEDLQDNMEAL